MSLLKQYNKISKPVKASIWFVICSVVQKGIAFIVTPIFTRLLPADQYGIYNLYTTWLGIFTIFITFNMSYGIFNNAMVKYENDRARYISAMQGLTLLTSCVAFILYALFHDFFNSRTGLSSFIMVAMILRIMFTPAQNYWNAYQRYTYNYRSLIAVTLFMAFITPVISILLIKIVGMQADGRVLSALIVQVIVGSVLWFKQFKSGKKLFVKEYWCYALGLGLPLIPHYLSQVILNSSDKIMISHICGQEAVAYYSVAYSIGLVIQLLTTSVNNSLIPWTYQKIKLENYEQISKVVNILLLMLGIAILTFVAFGPEMIRIMAPDSYYGARWVVPPVAGSVFFTFLYGVFGNVEFYYGKTKMIALASTVCAGCNILLNSVFVPLFGYVAAGYTTLICYVGFAMFHYLMMKKVCDKNMPGVKVYDISFIGIISIGFIIVLLLTTMLYDFPLIRYTFILICMIVVFIKRKVFIDSIKVIFTR